MNKRSWLAIVMVGLLAACSANSTRQPKIQYYTLSPVAEPGYLKPEKIIGITLIDVPAYLQEQPLVMRSAQQHMQVANYHYWAELPDSALVKHLQYVLLANNKILLKSNCGACEKVKLAIRDLYPSAAGEVFFSGWYEYQGNYNAFSYQQLMDKPGYAAAVLTMQQMIAQLAKDMAEQIGQ